MSFDLAELFTDSVRHAMPLALAKKLHASFDHHGALVTAPGDGADLARAFARLWLALIDLVDDGFLVFYAHAQTSRPGKCQLKVRAAGTGAVAAAGAVGAVLERLGLVDDPPGPEGPRMRLRRAHGVCPFTAAQLEFASLPGEGVLLSAEWQLTAERIVLPAPAAAMPGPAWVIHDDAVVAESLMRRLERLGWAVTRFDAPLPAQRRLRAMDRGTLRPALVIALEGATVSPSDVQCLRPWLPAARLVYGVCEGSPALGSGDPIPGFEVHAQPFAPAELDRLALCAAPLQQRVAGM